MFDLRYLPCRWMFGIKQRGGAFGRIPKAEMWLMLDGVGSSEMGLL